MRILHVVGSLDPNTGGLANLAIRLASAQAGLGQTVSMAACHRAEAETRIATSSQRVPNWDRVRYHRIPITRPLLRLVGGGYARELRPAVESVDVVHLHGVWDPILFAAASVARDLGKPYVVAPQGMLDPWSLSQRAMKKRLALAMGYRKMLNRAMFLQGACDEEGRLIQRLSLASPVKVLHNGIYPEELDPLPASGEFYAAHPEFGQAPYVLFLSRLHFKKGLDYLADAFAQVHAKRPEVKLVVAGPDDGYRQTFVERIAQLKIEPHVHMVGALHGAMKYRAMVDAACFCLPSRQEGFSVAILEAMACASPVVISDECRFPEVQTGGAGFVTPLNPTAIADALVQVLKDANHATSMGQIGRRLILSGYTWPIIAQRCIEAYEQGMPARSNRCARP
jgi:glycosyltransferase involved in cell wall biosynthesis